MVCGASVWMKTLKDCSPFLEPPAFSSVSSVDLIWVQQKEESFCFAWFSWFPSALSRSSEKQSWPSRTIGSNLSHKDTRQVFKLLSQKGAAPLVGADGDKSRRGQISILVRCQILSEISTRTIKYNTEFLDVILNAVTVRVKKAVLHQISVVGEERPTIVDDILKLCLCWSCQLYIPIL